jgi:hypothetical protein
MKLELDATWRGRPPTEEDHRAIARVGDQLIADPKGWNRILWRPPLQGTALLVKATCTVCSAQGLPILLTSAVVLGQSEALLATALERLGTHACAEEVP